MKLHRRVLYREFWVPLELIPKHLQPRFKKLEQPYLAQFLPRGRGK